MCYHGHMTSNSSDTSLFRAVRDHHADNVAHFAPHASQYALISSFQVAMLQRNEPCMQALAPHLDFDAPEATKAFELAVINCKQSAVEMMLQYYTPSDLSTNILMDAAKHNLIDLVNRVLPFCKPPEGTHLAMRAAVEWGHVEMIKLLDPHSVSPPEQLIDAVMMCNAERADEIVDLFYDLWSLPEIERQLPMYGNGDVQPKGYQHIKSRWEQNVLTQHTEHCGTGRMQRKI